MIWYFKEAKRIFYLMFYIGILFIIWALSAFKFGITVNRIIIIVSAIVWYVMAFIVSTRYSYQKLKDIQKILYDECDSGRYIEAIDNIIKRKRWKNQNITFLLLLKSIGLFEDGRINESWDILKSINHFSGNFIGERDKVIYYSRLFFIYFENDRLDNAEKALNDMNYAIINSKHLKALRKALYNSYVENKSWLCKLKESKEDIEKFYILNFQNSLHLLKKVDIKFKLAKLYFEAGRYDEAKEAFTYVLQNGSRLYKASEAVIYLHKIGQVS